MDLDFSFKDVMAYLTVHHPILLQNSGSNVYVRGS